MSEATGRLRKFNQTANNKEKAAFTPVANLQPNADELRGFGQASQYEQSMADEVNLTWHNESSAFHTAMYQTQQHSFDMQGG